MKSIAEGVREYRQCYQKYAREELDYYKKRESLSEVIQLAAQAKTSSGHKDRHQSRVPPSRLKVFAERLASKEVEIEKAQSFDELHQIVTSCRIFGIGPLTLYDCAFKISAYLEIEPGSVYLHSGTLVGAKRLGLAVRGDKIIPISKIPPPLNELEAFEIENCLCSVFGKKLL